MGNRLELQTILEDVLESKNVYFQPPESLKIKYPCIIYELENDIVEHADDIKYFRKKRYSLTIIDKNPDTLIPDRVSEIQYCSFNRFYTSDNLNHYVYQIYF